MTPEVTSWDELQQGLGTLIPDPLAADLPTDSEISGWLALRYDFDEECDEEAELFLLRTVLAVRKGFGPPSRRSLHHGQRLWYEQNRLADLCN